ncbi:MAG: hypothetical protein ACNI27_14970 [Desulfovibrio sp.]
MLVIKCARCRKKLWKYFKIGSGEVLRCHKERIKKEFIPIEKMQKEHKLICPCGNIIALDKGKHFSMVKKSVTYSGTKDPKR